MLWQSTWKDPLTPCNRYKKAFVLVNDVVLTDPIKIPTCYLQVNQLRRVTGCQGERVKTNITVSQSGVSFWCDESVGALLRKHVKSLTKVNICSFSHILSKSVASIFCFAETENENSLTIYSPSSQSKTDFLSFYRPKKRGRDVRMLMLLFSIQNSEQYKQLQSFTKELSKSFLPIPKTRHIFIPITDI